MSDTTPAHVALLYQYRDASNYKNGGHVIVANPEGLKLKVAAARIRTACDEGTFFLAHQVGVPEVFLWDADAEYDPDDKSTYPPNLGPGSYRLTEDDHCWHEFTGVTASEAAVTDGRTLTQLVEAFEAAHRAGWQKFAPRSRRRVQG